MGIKEVFGFSPEARSYKEFLNRLRSLQASLESLVAKHDALLAQNVKSMELRIQMENGVIHDFPADGKVVEAVRTKLLEQFAKEIASVRAQMDDLIHKESKARSR